MVLRESWYEKLQRWEDGLEAYERKQLVEPDSVDCALGRMRCLRSLGEWERLANLSADFWNRAGSSSSGSSGGDGSYGYSLTGNERENKKAVAPLAATAAIHLGRWDSIERYVSVMDAGGISGSGSGSGGGGAGSAVGASSSGASLSVGAGDQKSLNLSSSNNNKSQSTQSVESCFFRAIIAVHRNSYAEAQRYIDR